MYGERKTFRKKSPFCQSLLMNDSFRTVNGISEGQVNEQKSKFLSFAFPVKSVDEVKEYLKEYKKRYYDARHVCWAYLLGAEQEEFRTNDDGEPPSTAGKPILGAIKSKGLTNVLLIVVRYFGGIKLGTGGLTSTYRAAADDALEHAEIVEATLDEEMSVNFEYENINRVMKIVKEMNPSVVYQNLDMQCTLTLRIRKSLSLRLKSELLKIDRLKLQDE